MMSRQSRTSAEACATPFASWQELRCPECGGPLVSAEASGRDPELTCEPCAMRFPVLDGIPRLLPVHLYLRRAGWVHRSSLPPPTVLEPQAPQDDRVTAQGTATAVSSRS